MNRGRIHAVFALACSLVAVACGSSGSNLARSTPGPARIDGAELLLAYATRTSTFPAAGGDIAALEEARRNARGPDRRPAMRDLAYAHMIAAERTTGREAVRHRKDALRIAENAANGNRDAQLAAELAFIDLWSAWRAGRRNAAGIAERFTRRHNTSGELLVLAWIIRGEIALERERWNEAATSYRFVLGQLGHPLYAFALYRTGESLRGAGRDADAQSAFEEARQLGCGSDVAPETDQAARAAAAVLRTPYVDDESGRSRPSTCPVRAAGGADDTSAIE